MYEFNYHRPASLKEARTILAGASDARIVAGGMTLLPAMKFRLARPSDLVDLAHVGELRGIREKGDQLEIGAMMRHAEIAGGELVRSRIAALADLAQGIGDPQVRNRGTLGGSVANSDPAADYPAAVLALDAVIRTDRRDIPAADFFTGMFETALAPAEILTSVVFRQPKRAAYAKFPNPASRYAVVGVMVAEHADAVRVAVTGAGPRAFRAPQLEQALSRNFSPASLDGLHIDADDFNSDMHATAEYRAHLVLVMARRAVAAASA
ncbi:MAG: xanthine dehydrogenase family protein subunit M [Woeseiaceae bacterium]|nr:xanthine dehydrogenase family protein subunit M [Woeseiaceae bacterium]